MAAPVCSNCGQPGRLLEMALTLGRVDYYRCDACGQVWVIDKDPPNAEPRVVVPPNKA